MRFHGVKSPTNPEGKSVEDDAPENAEPKHDSNKIHSGSENDKGHECKHKVDSLFGSKIKEIRDEFMYNILVAPTNVIPSSFSEKRPALLSS